MFKGFSEDDGGAGVVFLRHDVDKDVAAARQIAKIEHQIGVRSSFFFLLRSRIYSLLEPETLDEVKSIAQMGHNIGLHCDERRMLQAQESTMENLDTAVLRELGVLEQVLGFPCSREVSFHNPSRTVIGRTPHTAGYVSTYDPRFIMPHTKYLSDSNAVWREGDPLPSLRNQVWPRLQILIHPIWWASEQAEEAIAILRMTVRNRLEQVDAYLRYSSDIWRANAKED